MKTVVVVGLLPGQENRLLRRVRGVRLRFVGTEKGAPRLPPGDLCLVLIKFCKHIWTDAAFRQFGHGKVRYVRGIDAAVQAIKEVT